MVQFTGGRLPPDTSKPRLRLGRYLRQPPSYQQVDYLGKVTSWPMYLNDRIGDCTCAGVGHILEAVSTYGRGTTVTLSDGDVLTAYEAVSGYDPETGANDTGARMQDVLSYWRKTGLAGHRILAFAELDVKNVDELARGLETFGSLYVGINFPESAMSQFEAHEPWDVIPGDRIEGGHAIHVGYLDLDEKAPWRLITWGAVQAMTQHFWDNYVEEAWIAVTPEWLDANGASPDGLDLAALGRDFASLTGEPDPF